MPTTYAIPNGRTVMGVSLINGTGAAQTISNADLGTTGFKPDLIWPKMRSGADGNFPVDTVRGIDKYLITNSTAAETTDAQEVTSVNSNGFTVGTSTNANRSGYTFVAWQWQAGQGTNTTNTNGSITSTVSVNPTAGFSIVSYTTQSSGTGTVGHGLGVAPSLIILKNRQLNNNWIVYHTSLGASAYLYLNTTSASVSDTSVFNGTNPTSTVFTMGTGEAGSISTIAYCWAQVAGFSQFGSYTGNGSTDGPFIYTGFRPRYVMIKATSSVSYGYWMIHDTARGTYNVVNQNLYANYSYAEDTDAAGNMDILSNGFKLRGTVDNANGNGSSYIYMAFAENPFKYANAR